MNPFTNPDMWIPHVSGLYFFFTVFSLPSNSSRVEPAKLAWSSAHIVVGLVRQWCGHAGSLGRAVVGVGLAFAWPGAAVGAGSLGRAWSLLGWVLLGVARRGVLHHHGWRNVEL